jgi:hypothetical protein
LVIELDENSELKPIKLGKKIELKYIPFSELAIPWNVCLGESRSKPENNDVENSHPSIIKKTKNSKQSKTLKVADIDALKRSIAQFGLLKPFEVAEMEERLDFFYGKGRYLVIDGQRRYFAVRELLKLPSEDDERKQRDNLQTNCRDGNVAKVEMNAQEGFDCLSIRDYVLVPCIVYPYANQLQMLRHSIEDKRFSERPSKDDFKVAEKMAEEGIRDIDPDDLRELWKTRSHLEKEKKNIENTLRELRERIKTKS